MAENRAEILTGAAVLAVALGFLAYTLQGRAAVGQGDYDLHASFRSLEGVQVGADVRLAGVRIGRIAAIDLNPQTFYADATVRLSDKVQIPDDSAILINSDGLLGGAYVEIAPGGSAVNYMPGDEIEDTQGAVSLISLLMKFIDSTGSTAQTEPSK